MASSTQRQSLATDLSHYLKAYEVYVKKSTAQKETVKWIEQNIPVLLQQERSTDEVPDVFNILSVGCGNGSVGDLLIMKAVASYIRSKKPDCKPIISNKALDPSPDAVDAFYSATNAWKEDFGQIDILFERSVKTWQQYVETTKQEPQKFHIISFIQSIYYMEPEACLQNCLEERLSENGIIVCMNVSEDVFFNYFAKKFYGTELLIVPTGITYHTSESIAAIAEKNGWKYKHFCFEFSLEVEDIFDESSMEGSLLFDFLVQTVNFRSVTSKTDKESVLGFLDERCKSGDNGKRLLYEKVGVVVIFKNQFVKFKTAVDKQIVAFEFDHAKNILLTVTGSAKMPNVYQNKYQLINN